MSACRRVMSASRSGSVAAIAATGPHARVEVGPRLHVLLRGHPVVARLEAPGQAVRAGHAAGLALSDLGQHGRVELVGDESGPGERIGRDRRALVAFGAVGERQPELDRDVDELTEGGVDVARTRQPVHRELGRVQPIARILGSRCLADEFDHHVEVSTVEVLSRAEQRRRLVRLTTRPGHRGPAGEHRRSDTGRLGGRQDRVVEEAGGRRQPVLADRQPREQQLEPPGGGSVGQIQPVPGQLSARPEHVECADHVVLFEALQGVSGSGCEQPGGCRQCDVGDEPADRIEPVARGRVVEVRDPGEHTGPRGPREEPGDPVPLGRPAVSGVAHHRRELAHGPVESAKVSLRRLQRLDLVAKPRPHESDRLQEVPMCSRPTPRRHGARLRCSVPNSASTRPEAGAR